MRQSPAPSMRAASSRECGMPRKNCRRKKMPNAFVARGMINPGKVFISPSLETIWYVGISVTWNGDHQEQDDRQEQHAAAGEVEPRQRERRHGVEAQRDDR